jgi:hypothetical protein
MSKYVCPSCNKDFKQKINFLNHTEKKKVPCKGPCISSVDKSIYEDSLQNACNSSILPAEPIIFTCKMPATACKMPAENKSNKEDKLNCSYCDMSFTRKDNLSKHIRERCKNKKHFDNVDVIKSKITNSVIISSDKYEKLLDDNVKLINMLEEYKQFIKENNLIKQSIPCMITNNNNNNINNSNTNNGAINNGNINSGNTINVVQFGKEDISKCDLVEMMSVYLKSTGGNIFPNMLKYLNFNPKYPQNFNISMCDMAREIVKIHDGKKFISKKFKNVKNQILNVINEHITNMCTSYLENPKTKKNEYILDKMRINDISTKLINNDDITPLLKIKNKKEINYDSDGNQIENDNNDNDDDDDELDAEGERRLAHYESKRQGLQEITEQGLRDELYNNRNLIVGL